MLSVITLSYKNPKDLELTLKSLLPLYQSELSWEHVIVDSSPDENKKVISACPPNWPLVHVTATPEGIYPAMNLGIKHVSGSVVWFLNSGDRLKSLTALKNVLDCFNQDSKFDLVCATADLFRDSKYIYSKTPIRPFLRNLIGANGLCHQAVIYRRAALEQVGEFSTKFRLASDYEHHYRCYIKKLKVQFSAQSLVEYDVGGRSSQFKEALSEFRKVHLTLAPQMPIWVRLANALLWFEECIKISVLKYLSRSPLASGLRPAWLAWNRGKNKFRSRVQAIITKGCTFLKF